MPSQDAHQSSAYPTTELSAQLKQITTWLFHLLIFCTPFLFSFETDELFEFNKMLFVYALSTLIVGIHIVRSILEKKILFTATTFDWVIFGFLGSQLLSTAFSMHLHTSIFGYYSRFHGGLLSTVCYTALYVVFVSTFSKKHVFPFLYTLILSAGFVALYALPERFHISLSCWLLDQEFTTECWSENTNPKYRIFGTFGQPNWLAAYAILIMPLAAVLAVIKPTLERVTNKATILSWASGSVAVLLFATLLFTKSRSGFLGFVAAVIIGAAIIGWQAWKKTAIFPLHRSAYWLVGSLLSIAVIAGTPFTPDLRTLFSTQSESNSNIPQPADRLEAGGTDSGEIRKIVWEGAWNVFLRYPLLGSGVETFAYSYYLDRPVEHNLVSEWDFLYNKAHNEFLNFLATTGIVGGGSYILLLGFIGITLVKVIADGQRSAAAERAILLALLLGIAALSVSNFFGFSTVTVSLLLFLFFAISAVLGNQTLSLAPLKNTASTEYQAKTTRSIWQNTAIALVTGCVLILLSRVLNYWQADHAYSEGKKYVGAGYISEGIQLLSDATRRSPDEAVYFSELSQAYTEGALEEARAGNSTNSAALAEAAILSDRYALFRNPEQLNLYKSSAQILIKLSELQPETLIQARDILAAARVRAPTDPRLSFNLSLVEESLGNVNEARTLLEETIQLKPNYGAARMRLGSQLFVEENYSAAAHEFQYVLDYIAPSDAAAQSLLEQALASASASSETAP